MLDFDEALKNEKGYVWGFSREDWNFPWDGSEIRIGPLCFGKNKFFYDNLVVNIHTHTVVPGNFVYYYLDNEGNEIEGTRDNTVEFCHELYTCNNFKLSPSLVEEIKQVINDYFMTEEEIDGVIDYVNKKIEKELSQNN